MLALRFRSLTSSSARTAFLNKPGRNFHYTPSRTTVYANANTETFNKVITTEGRAVLVDFHADWCGPCRQLAPVLEKYTTDSRKSGSGLPLDLVKVDTESEHGKELAQIYQVRALPTVVAFKNGEAVAQFVGALPESAVARFIAEKL